MEQIRRPTSANATRGRVRATLKANEEKFLRPVYVSKQDQKDDFAVRATLRITVFFLSSSFFFLFFPSKFVVFRKTRCASIVDTHVREMEILSYSRVSFPFRVNSNFVY